MLLPAQLIHCDVTLEEAEEAWQNLGFQMPDACDLSIQPKWEKFRFERTLDEMIHSSDSVEDKTRLLASREESAGSWLNTLPSAQLGTMLDNDSFRISVALRLGAVICESHVCICGQEVSVNGLHGLSCSKSAGRLSRHSMANDILLRALVSAEVPSVREPPGLSRDDGRHPDGLTLVPWSRGKALIWDFTCSDSYAASYVNHCSSNPGYAAKLAETRKKRHYEDLAERYHFVPVALETTGVWGEEGLAFVKEIGRRIHEKTGEARSTSYLLQRLSLALQRGNVASILGTIPHGKELTEVYYL
jgi:hypothetical protein